MDIPYVICPKCATKKALDEVLIAQSNQNVIFTCPVCSFTKKNIVTSKG
jgi:rubredoxin